MDQKPLKVQSPDAQKALVDASGNNEEKAADSHDLRPSQMPQVSVQDPQKDHAGTDQGQDSEDHSLVRDHKAGDQGHQGSAGEYDQAPGKRLPGKGDAESRKENKGPADGLLPYICHLAVIPAPVRA